MTPKFKDYPWAEFRNEKDEYWADVIAWEKWMDSTEIIGGIDREALLATIENGFTSPWAKYALYCLMCDAINKTYEEC